MKFLANENIPLDSIILLRKTGFDVSSILQERPGSADIDVLKQAHQEKLIILTFDRDYGELIFKYHKFLPEGVVYFRFDPSFPEEPARILIKILRKSQFSLIRKFTVIELDRIRQRNY